MPRLRFIKKHNEYQIDYYQDGKRIRRYLGADKKHAEKELKRVDAFLKAEKLGFELQTHPKAPYITSETSVTATPEKAIAGDHIPIAEAINLYLARCKEAVPLGNMTEKTYDQKVSLFKGRFSRFLQKKCPKLKYLDDIEKAHIESYRAYRINSRHKQAPHKKIKPITFNNDLRDLISFFNYCVENQKTFHIIRNPAAKVGKIRKADQDERPPCLSPDETEQILEKCSNDTELRNVIEAFLHTGMRYNELRNFRWQDVDLEKGFVEVKSREGFLTKSRRSHTIPISKRMAELLKEIPKRGIKVFDLNNVKKITLKKDNLCNLRKRFEKIKKQLPFLRTGHRFHIFRHTAITRWANSGVPLPLVQKWAGHSSIEMTMKYVHPSEEESIEWMKKFSDFTQLSRNDSHPPAASL